MKCGIGMLAMLLTAATVSAADVSGEWQLVATVLNDVAYARVTLKVDGGKLSGTLGENTLDGTIKGDEFTFTATRPNGQPFGNFRAKANGDALKGLASWPGIPGDVSWSATRPARPPARPNVHDFEPTEFHRVFSDAIPPVLRIFPGENVDR
jgi:amidase